MKPPVIAKVPLADAGADIKARIAAASRVFARTVMRHPLPDDLRAMVGVFIEHERPVVCWRRRAEMIAEFSRGGLGDRAIAEQLSAPRKSKTFGMVIVLDDGRGGDLASVSNLPVDVFSKGPVS